jgi:hypothetical protein
MVSSTSIIIIISIVVVLFIIIGIALYLVSRRNNGGGGGGTTGGTGAIGNTCSNICTPIGRGCSATNILSVGFTGAGNCTQTCLNSTTTTNLSGCIGPQCNTGNCNLQQTLYSNVLQQNNQLVTFCSSGGPQFGLIPSPCIPNISGLALSQLTVTPSSINNNKIFPIYITTINKSIYSVTQPVPPDNVPVSSIQVNTGDPTVIDNPYILYRNPANQGKISMQRLNFIKQNLNINDAIWIYNTDLNQLQLFSDLEMPSGINFQALREINLNNFFFGNDAPCAFSLYETVSLGDTAKSIIYNNNNGLFSITQQVNTDANPSGAFHTENMLISTVHTITPEGLEITTAPVEGVDYSGTCIFSESSRFYSISAINQYL